jgi:hypothetical protein
LPLKILQQILYSYLEDISNAFYSITNVVVFTSASRCKRGLVERTVSKKTTASIVLEKKTVQLVPVLHKEKAMKLAHTFSRFLIQPIQKRLSFANLKL